MSNSRKKKKARQLELNRTEHCALSLSCEYFPGSKKQCKDCPNWKKATKFKLKK